ncbi:hypothetical protein ACH4U5_31105 [Streptomyces sp. NPDC020858]|uniref:hypothetical protein n=1 Tax=Streptomyces sp. NPDC020858 TaxID=3365097 RepID=UPI003799AEDF
MAGLHMPSLSVLPAGPHRTLVEHLHGLYRRAGKPSLRDMASGMRRQDDLPGTLSHEGIGNILRGKGGVPTWRSVETLTRYLTGISVVGEDVDAQVRMVHSLWLTADDERPHPPERLDNFKYHCTMDLVLCALTTQPGSTVLLQRGFLHLFQRLQEAMEAKGKIVSQLRVKLIHAGGESPFFNFPKEHYGFYDQLLSLTPVDSDNLPRRSLQALRQAVDADWCVDGAERYRHVIVAFSDTPTGEVGEVSESSDTDYLLWRDLDAEWARQQSQLGPNFKGITLFAPESFPWTDISSDWPLALHFPSEAGKSLEDFEFDEIIETLSNDL